MKANERQPEDVIRFLAQMMGTQPPIMSEAYSDRFLSDAFKALHWEVLAISIYRETRYFLLRVEPGGVVMALMLEREMRVAVGDEVKAIVSARNQHISERELELSVRD